MQNQAFKSEFGKEASNVDVVLRTAMAENYQRKLNLVNGFKLSFLLSRKLGLGISLVLLRLHSYHSRLAGGSPTITSSNCPLRSVLLRSLSLVHPVNLGIRPIILGVYLVFPSLQCVDVSGRFSSSRPCRCHQIVQVVPSALKQ